MNKIGHSTGVLFSGDFLLILALILTFSACEKVDGDLKDLSLTGKWKLYNTSSGLPGNQVRGIICDSKHNMWFAVSANGAAKYTAGAWTYYKTTNSGILSNGVTCMAEDSKGNILFGTTNGISILSTSNSWSSYRHPSLALYVTCLKKDNKGVVWFGTLDQGYFVFNSTVPTQVYYELYRTVNDIEQDSKGNMWMGTDNGLVKWDGKTHSVLTTANGLPDNTITALFNDSRNRLWIGTYFGKTVAMMDDKGLHKFSLFNGDMITEINDICEDASGNIWFATYDSGLIKFDGVVPYAYKKYNGLPENDIVAAARDNEGNVWFGLYSKGLTRYSLPIK